MLSSPAVQSRARRVIVLDTETTRLMQYDRIVTLGALRIEGDTVGKAFYLIFDPRKECHPSALNVHG